MFFEVYNAKTQVAAGFFRTDPGKTLSGHLVFAVAATGSGKGMTTNAFRLRFCLRLRPHGFRDAAFQMHPYVVYLL